MDKQKIDKAIKRLLKEHRPVFELLAEDWDHVLELSEEAQDILIKCADLTREEFQEIKAVRESEVEFEEGKGKILESLDELDN